MTEGRVSWAEYKTQTSKIHSKSINCSATKTDSKLGMNFASHEWHVKQDNKSAKNSGCQLSFKCMSLHSKANREV